jgi:hypothetical protein
MALSQWGEQIVRKLELPIRQAIPVSLKLIWNFEKLGPVTAAGLTDAYA